MAASSGSGGGSASPPALVAPRRRASCAGLLRPGEDVDPGPLGQGDLGGDVGGAPEAVDAEPPARRQVGPPERPVADDARAQEGGRLLVGEGRRDDVGEGLVDHQVLGVPAVEVPAGEAGVEAQVLPARHTEAAHPAGVGQPRDAHPVARREAGAPVARPVDHAHHLVARDHQVAGGRQVPLGQVEVGPADAAHRDPDPDLARTRLGDRTLHPGEGSRGHRPGDVDRPCLHRPVGHGFLLVPVHHGRARPPAVRVPGPAGEGPRTLAPRRSRGSRCREEGVRWIG